jgi:putative integral membrane protein (TIGR02587 family)
MARARRAVAKGADDWGWRREGRDLLVAVTGGAIVGMPLLYTMEMWEHGMLLGPTQQLGLLAGTLLVNFLFSVVSGFRHEFGAASAVLESVTAVGIALIFSTLVLLLIGEIGLGDNLDELVGKVLFQTAAVSLGVSVADSHVRGKRRDGSEEERDAPREKPSREQLERLQLRQDIRDVSVTLTGAVLFSVNIGPTEEVVVIAGRLMPWQLLVLALASLALCYVILYASGIKDHPVHVPSLVQSPPAETMVMYALSLLVSGVLLWGFGEPESVGSLDSWIAASIVLGLPTAVGGAAGRLAL